MDGTDPNDEELIEFALLLLRDHQGLRDRELLEEAISEHRDLWALLYWIGKEEPSPPPQEPPPPSEAG